MYHTLSKLFCLVAIARRSHLFPCRTQKLSSLAPMVVGLTFRKSRTLPGNVLLFHSSSVVELSAVNRSVVGSSPTCGAIWPRGQAVKTPPFHGGNTGSSPVGVIILWRISSAGRASALQAEGRRFEPVILHHC